MRGRMIVSIIRVVGIDDLTCFREVVLNETQMTTPRRGMRLLDYKEHL